MTIVSLADLRSRLCYEAYAATQHAGCGGDEAAALAYRRDIRPLLSPSAAGPVVDLGCGRGELVRLMQVEAITATDLLEHLIKPKVLRTFGDVAAAPAPGGVFVARVPARPHRHPELDLRSPKGVVTLKLAES